MVVFVSPILKRAILEHVKASNLGDILKEKS